MKTLYTRIVLTVFMILLLSGAIALLVSNVAYYVWWQPSYSEKTEQTAQAALDYFETHTDGETSAFYRLLAQTGYQLIVVRPDGEIDRYGGSFRDESLDADIIASVRSGERYDGMRAYPFHLFWLGLFDNEVVNTYGFSLDGEDAVFIRPDLGAQIRELHLFVGLFFALLTGLAFVLIALSASLIVRPVRTLTDATRSVASGARPLDLPTERNDEIGTLARRFSDMVDSLEKSEGERRRFVSSVSHEFQTPLTSIKGYASELAARTEGDAWMYAEIIRDETDRLSDLTKQLLLLARLDESNVSLSEQVDVSASIEDVIRRHAFQLDEKGIAVATELDTSLVVTGDPLLLAQVWTNLLTNAIHASHDGGLIAIKAYASDRPTVSIQDVGVGMDEATQARLFERFYKGDVSRTGRGTGLGLAIAQDIVRLHGGEMTVESRLGTGSTFYVRF
ncbi:cell wall metabolism sensor histidine kinase WalK [Exiguobacterium sp. TNDT2]|uniref:sensor histidine kinase n=1 Tax=Exiguobacterium sp. TNDT2 TaxID=2233531 RepID=UPI000DEF7C4D|nr:HAMP domain-containing sensor histidine kinase [Exiguobacterium sp. TNDT2]